jgi:hypothetical protein
MTDPSSPIAEQSAILLARERTCLHLILVSASHPSPGTPPPPPLLPEGEGEMTSPPACSTWARVVKGYQPPAVSPGPSPPPSAHLLQFYKDWVARGTWARLIFETMGGEEELSFSCRVQAGEPPKSRVKSAQLMRGGGNRRGGEGKLVRREGGPLQQQVKPLPPAAVEENQRVEK